MIRWFTGRPTAANLLLLLFLVAEAFAAPGLLRETFPDFRAVEAEITVPYRGAAAADVEAAICARSVTVCGVSTGWRPSTAQHKAASRATWQRWRRATTRCASSMRCAPRFRPSTVFSTGPIQSSCASGTAPFP
jgi:hypothetical protein